LALPGSSSITWQGKGMPSGAGATGTAVLVLSTLQALLPPPPPLLLLLEEPPVPPVLGSVLPASDEYDEQATGMTAMDAAARDASRIERISFIFEISSGF
jgi:hypothetical protein